MHVSISFTGMCIFIKSRPNVLHKYVLTDLHRRRNRGGSKVINNCNQNIFFFGLSIVKFLNKSTTPTLLICFRCHSTLQRPTKFGCTTSRYLSTGIRSSSAINLAIPVACLCLVVCDMTSVLW